MMNEEEVKWFEQALKNNARRYLRLLKADESDGNVTYCQRKFFEFLPNQASEYVGERVMQEYHELKDNAMTEEQYIHAMLVLCKGLANLKDLDELSYEKYEQGVELCIGRAMVNATYEQGEACIDYHIFRVVAYLMMLDLYSMLM